MSGSLTEGSQRTTKQSKGTTSAELAAHPVRGTAVTFRCTTPRVAPRLKGSDLRQRLAPGPETTGHFPSPAPFAPLLLERPFILRIRVVLQLACCTVINDFRFTSFSDLKSAR